MRRLNIRKSMLYILFLIYSERKFLLDGAENA